MPIPHSHPTHKRNTHPQTPKHEAKAAERASTVSVRQSYEEDDSEDTCTPCEEEDTCLRASTVMSARQSMKRGSELSAGHRLKLVIPALKQKS